jgi:hypothetical protein
MSQAMIDAARRLTSAGNAAQVVLRAIGGVGVLLHCPVALAQGPHREFGDLDLAAPSDGSRRIADVFGVAGYQPDRRFNAMQGDRRMLFHGDAGKVDVFIGAFEMCHRIELSERLSLEPDTASATDLLLTKLQVVELNDKDVQDIALLLSEHGLGPGEGDHINVDYLSAVTGDDWGLWRTASGTLQKVGEMRPDVSERAQELLTVLEQAPKSRRFRLRARVGERVRWYELPDAIER